MKKAPNLIQYTHIINGGFRNTEIRCTKNGMIGGPTVHARPHGFFSLSNRLALAWGVFTGRYDALKWPAEQ
jgi:hypothetical protein